MKPRPPASTRIDALTLDPQNRRQRTARGRDLIVRSLKETGAARSIVIDEDDVVLAGNGVVDAATEAGISTVRIIEAEGDELIAVRRRGLTGEQKRALALFDNRTGELAEWNVDQLRADAEAGLDLQPFFFDAELKDLFGEKAKPGLTDPDSVPHERATQIQPGDLFELGPHRLTCGDCTVADSVASVMRDDKAVLINTDPPYGVDYAALVGSRQNQKVGGWNAIKGDALDDDALGALLVGALSKVAVPVAFVWHPSNRVEVFLVALRTVGLTPSQQIVWVKNALVFGRADYQWRHEPCIYAKRKGAGGVSDRTQTTVWEVNKTSDAEHPTQKPVELFTRPIVNHTRLADVVYEPFAGSGSQFIAAEQLGRRCYGVEIEPQYCQVIVDRWEAFTGLKATKVGEAVRA